MSKKFKGKTCVYCAKRASTSADHVIAREFLLPGKRENLPKVPACDICQREKSKLEHYLTTVLPFGARHPDAALTLERLVPKRLAKNVALHRQIANQMSTVWTDELGFYAPTKAIPLDDNAVDILFSFIVKGLIWHHWKTWLPVDHFIQTRMYTLYGLQWFHDHIFSLNAGAVAKGNLGNGVFVYEGHQGVKAPHVTAWRMSLYGLIVPGDEGPPGLCFGSVSGPQSILQRS